MKKFWFLLISLILLPLGIKAENFYAGVRSENVSDGAFFEGGDTIYITSFEYHLNNDKYGSDPMYCIDGGVATPWAINNLVDLDTSNYSIGKYLIPIYAAADAIGASRTTASDASRIIIALYSPKISGVTYHPYLNVSSNQFLNMLKNAGYTLAGLEMDTDTICAALLHDVVEDTDATNEDLIREFGESVAEMVDGVTKLGKLQYTTKEEQQVEDYRKMFLAMGKDIRVILIKLADRLHNMRTLKFLSRERQIANAKETMDLYAPLANRLGIYSLKWELEDLSFKYLYPDEYHEIVKGLDKKREERLAFIDSIMDEIRVELKNAKINAEVTGRAKHIYSIYRKMQRDNSTLDQVYDLFALRILVNSVRDCYAALGIVHDLYNPMPGRFKDYISVPKKNMYQSIHTTLIGPNGTPFEVQIRTWDMHRVAEFGIAAHWAYKEQSYKGKKKAVVVKDDKLSWLRETLEWQKNTENPDEFLNTLKKELFEDEVHVFTPKGDIKVLPRGSTPIDLAYAIHEQVGHRMIGAKINSKMMPIVTKLQNGDIVEIITSDSAKGPSRDWLKFVKSSGAKTKIQQWFKKAQREENIEKGKDILEKDIKKLGMKHSDLFKP